MLTASRATRGKAFNICSLGFLNDILLRLGFHGLDTLPRPGCRLDALTFRIPVQFARLSRPLFAATSGFNVHFDLLVPSINERSIVPRLAIQ